MEEMNCFVHMHRQRLSELVIQCMLVLAQKREQYKNRQEEIVIEQRTYTFWKLFTGGFRFSELEAEAMRLDFELAHLSVFEKKLDGLLTSTVDAGSDDFLINTDLFNKMIHYAKESPSWHTIM